MIFACPDCGQGMEAPNSAVGKKLLCPSCQFTFVARLPKATVVGEADEDVGDVHPAADDYDDAEILGPAGGDPFPSVYTREGGPTAPGYAPPPAPPARPMGGFRGGRRSRSQAMTDALARLAAGEPVGEEAESRHPPMPPGWYLEDLDGLKGPYTSLDISKAMYQGSMPSDAMLWHSTKNVRVKVREVRDLVRKIGDEKKRAKSAASARAAEAVRAAQAEKTKKAKKAARPVAKPEPEDEEPAEDRPPQTQGTPATDALSLLAQAARTSRPGPTGRAAPRTPEAHTPPPSQPRGACAVLWVVRVVLLACGATTALPWLSTAAAVATTGPASRPVQSAMTLFQLSTPMAIVIVLCFVAAVGVSFLVAGHRVAQIGFASQVAVTCLVVLVPFIFYGGVGRQPAAGARTPVAMGWGAWLCLAMNVLAMLLAVVYLFVRAKGAAAGGYAAELVKEDLDEDDMPILDEGSAHEEPTEQDEAEDDPPS